MKKTNDPDKVNPVETKEIPDPGDKSLFTIELADVRIGIRPKDETLRNFCRHYLCDDTPDFIVETKEEDIQSERERAIAYHGRDDSQPTELEKLFIYRQIAEKMPFYDAFLIHAAAVSVDGRGYLFSGPSGTGKSTHAKLWKKHFEDRMRFINDDKPLLKATGHGIRIFGSPWCGKERKNNNISAPLCGILCLRQGKENRITTLSRSQLWEKMMHQVYRSRDPETMRRIFELTDRMLKKVPVREMECTKDPEAVKVAYEALTGEAFR